MLSLRAGRLIARKKLIPLLMETHFANFSALDSETVKRMPIAKAPLPLAMAVLASLLPRTIQGEFREVPLPILR